MINVAILDYGIGNVHTLAGALERAGAYVKVETEPVAALQFDALVLPPTGSYSAAASRLGLYAPSIRAALASGHPCLGICLGMQLLFETSEEGEGAGLAAMRGQGRRLQGRRTLHVGWNDVVPVVSDVLFSEIPVMLGYYAHSYIVDPIDEANVIAWTEREQTRFPAVVCRDRTWGVQFRPEKSGAAGLRLLANFIAAAGAQAVDFARAEAGSSTKER